MKKQKSKKALNEKQGFKPNIYVVSVAVVLLVILAFFMLTLTPPKRDYDAAKSAAEAEAERIAMLLAGSETQGEVASETMVYLVQGLPIEGKEVPYKVVITDKIVNVSIASAEYPGVYDFAVIGGGNFVYSNTKGRDAFYCGPVSTSSYSSFKISKSKAHEYNTEDEELYIIDTIEILESDGCHGKLSIHRMRITEEAAVEQAETDQSDEYATFSAALTDLLQAETGEMPSPANKTEFLDYIERFIDSNLDGLISTYSTELQKKWGYHECSPDDLIHRLLVVKPIDSDTGSTSYSDPIPINQGKVQIWAFFSRFYITCLDDNNDEHTYSLPSPIITLTLSNLP